MTTSATTNVRRIRCPFRKAPIIAQTPLHRHTMIVARAVDIGRSSSASVQRDRWLLGEAYVELQVGLIGAATLNDRGNIISAPVDLGPALLRCQVSPEFHPIALALTYAKTHLIPLLTRVWSLPDDLPHAAGMGDLARVKRWFDESGAPALGDLEKHFPCNDPQTLMARGRGTAAGTETTSEQF